MEISSTASFVLIKKLKALKVNFRHWNRESFGRVEERKKLALKTMAIRPEKFQFLEKWQNRNFWLRNSNFG